MTTTSRNSHHHVTMADKVLAAEVRGLGGTLAGVLDESTNPPSVPFFEQHTLPQQTTGRAHSGHRYRSKK